MTEKYKTSVLNLGRQNGTGEKYEEEMGTYILMSGCVDLLLSTACQLSTKAVRQSTLGYTHGSSLSVDGAQTTNSMMTQDTDKLFIQVRPPSWRNTYVLRLVVLICVERI